MSELQFVSFGEEGIILSIENRMVDLNLVLPALNRPAAAYIPGVMEGDLLFVSGQTPKVNGVLQYKGKLGSEISEEEGYQAAKLCALNCLAVVSELAGGLEKVQRIVKVTGFVNSTSDFTGHSQVLNGASDLFNLIFEERGTHARSAIGVNALPGSAVCEVELIVKLKESNHEKN